AEPDRGRAGRRLQDEHVAHQQPHDGLAAAVPRFDVRVYVHTIARLDLTDHATRRVDRDAHRALIWPEFACQPAAGREVRRGELLAGVDVRRRDLAAQLRGVGDRTRAHLLGDDRGRLEELSAGDRVARGAL